MHSLLDSPHVGLIRAAEPSPPQQQQELAWWYLEPIVTLAQWYLTLIVAQQHYEQQRAVLAQWLRSKDLPCNFGSDTVVSLGGLSLSVGDMWALELLVNLHAPTTVNLIGRQIGDNGLVSLGKSIEANGSLTNLDLSGNKLTDPTVLADVLEKEDASLKVLHLRTNQICDKGIVNLCSGLEYNTSLTKLHLRNNKLTDEAARALAKVLKKNTSLTELDLSANNLTEAAALALADVLRSNVSY